MGKLSILLVDDNSIFRSLVRDYIEQQEDMEVVGEAGDGEEALEQIENLMPDLVLLDIIMPRFDGLAVLEKLWEMNLEKRPVVMVLSAVGQDSITERALHLGATNTKNPPDERLSPSDHLFPSSTGERRFYLNPDEVSPHNKRY